MSEKKENIINFVLGIFFFLAGAGLIFSGVGIIGTFFLWWIAYALLFK